MINRILYTAAIAFIVLALGAFAAEAQSAGAVWQVKSYDINVTLPPSDGPRTAAVRATLVVRNVSAAPAGTLTLRITPLADVTAVTLNGSVFDAAKGEEKLGSAAPLQRLVIRPPAVQPGVSVTVSVDYKLSVKENSGVAALSPAGSQFLPNSSWYPSPTSWFYTKGADAAPFKVKVTAPAGQASISSGVETQGGFDQKLVGQPFLVSGAWDAATDNGVSIYSPRGVPDGAKRGAELAGIFRDAQTFVSGYLGAAPNVPLRIVAVRRGGGFSSGGTVLVDEGVFRRPKVDAQTAMTVAEAAVKCWLGGSITVNGEGYGIVSEGLVRYLANQFIESKYGKPVADIERLRQRVIYNAISKRDSAMGLVSPLDDFYYGVVANKGAMMWRLLAVRMGRDEFAAGLRSAAQDSNITLAELRSTYVTQKEILDYFLDVATDMNLLAGLPRQGNGEWLAALRNSGSIDATVTVRATTASGKVIDAPVSIKAQSFDEVAFRTAEKVVRVEIDAEKMYPQVEYYDDIAPRDTTESDQLLAIKKLFDKKSYAEAIVIARSTLAAMPQFDDARVLLARSLLLQNDTAGAEREFRAVLADALPTAKSMAWAMEGIAECAAAANKNADALAAIETAISYDADYGASYAARKLRTKLNGSTAVDAAIKTFFTDFDRAAAANRKADVDALVLGGEAAKFASGVSGSTEKWVTQVRQVDRLDSNTVLVETDLAVKLLNKNDESGLAVYRLIKVGNAWKLAGVEIFEVG